ncbi:MAG: CotH kinase family protein [Acidobacteriota bacterium]|nr:CotH kinase family protein [Acidobacteriota bacterium]
MCKHIATLVVLAILAVSPAQAQSADELFASETIQRVDLLLHSADWAKLKADFSTNTYYPADLAWNGQTVRNAGIRSRGRGSRSGTKPGLRVDFDRYASGQTFLGLKSFILDNLTQDPSGIHETVAAAFYARLGVPVSREIHTRLYVNNQYVGVYAIVESVDKDMLARIYGSIDGNVQNDGYLFEFKYQEDWRFSYPGSSLEPYKLLFDAKTNETKSDEDKYRAIETLVRLTNETPPDRITDAIGGLLDIPAFIRFVAGQSFLAETDGFVGAYGINNFYLYRLEDQNVHALISWDSDHTFWGAEFSLDLAWAGNTLIDKLMAVPEYQALYLSEVTRAVELAEADGWLDTEIIRQVQRIDAAMREDPAKPWSNATYEGSAGVMLSFARARLTFVKCELERGAGNSSCRTQ